MCSSLEYRSYFSQRNPLHGDTSAFSLPWDGLRCFSSAWGEKLNLREVLSPPPQVSLSNTHHVKDKMHPLVREKRKPRVECAVREELQVEAFRSIYQPKFFNDGKMHRLEKCNTSVRFLSTVKENTLFFCFFFASSDNTRACRCFTASRCKKK